MSIRKELRDLAPSTPEAKLCSKSKSMTASALKSNVPEKGVVGHSPRYFRDKTLFEIDIKLNRVMYYLKASHIMRELKESISALIL